MVKKLSAALVLLSALACPLVAQGGSYGNLTWRGSLEATSWNGRPAFILASLGPPQVILQWLGRPSFQFQAVAAAVLEPRSCVMGSRVYLHEWLNLGAGYEASFGPVLGTGFSVLQGGGVPFPPLEANLWEYTLTYCTVYEPWNQRMQGPCGESTCGNYRPSAWAVVLELR